MKEYNTTTRVQIKQLQKEDEIPKCITNLTLQQEKGLESDYKR